MLSMQNLEDINKKELKMVFFGNWVKLSNNTSVARSNYTQALAQMQESEFRWQSPTGTKFHLTRRKDGNKPTGFSDCGIPEKLYQTVAVRVMPTSGQNELYVLCDNPSSKAFITTSLYPGGSPGDQIVKKYYIDTKHNTLSFFVFGINDLTREVRFTCHLFLHNGESEMKSSGTATQSICEGYLQKVKESSEKYLLSLEKQSELIKDYAVKTGAN